MTSDQSGPRCAIFVVCKNSCLSSIKHAVLVLLQFCVKVISMDSQNEERILFDSIALWQEASQREYSNIIQESHKEFSSIIQSYCTRVNKGTSELSEEVGDLKAQLSVITQERDILLEKVDHLINEIKGLEDVTKERDALLERVENLSAEIKRLKQPVPQPIQSLYPDTQGVEGLGNEVQAAERPRISTDTRDPGKRAIFGINGDPLAVEDKAGDNQPEEKPPVETQNEQPMPEHAGKSWDCNICKTQVNHGSQYSHLRSHHNMSMTEYLKIQSLNKLSNQLNKSRTEASSLVQVEEANISLNSVPQKKTPLHFIRKVRLLESKSQDQIEIKNEAPISTEMNQQEAIVENEHVSTPLFKQAGPTADKTKSTEKQKTISTSLEVKTLLSD